MVEEWLQLLFDVRLQDVVGVHVGGVHDDEVEAAERQVAEGDESGKEEAGSGGGCLKGTLVESEGLFLVFHCITG